MLKIALVSLVLSTLSTFAVANDLTKPSEFKAPSPFSWTGVYGGLQGGRGYGHNVTLNSGTIRDTELNGSVVGGFVGYNRQFDNNVVLGVEGDVVHNSNDEIYPNFFLLKQGQDTNLSVRGRVGYAFDRFLIYGTGGFVKTQTHYSIVGGANTILSNYRGWTAGAGIDYAVTDHIFVRGEYRHNKFTDGNLSSADTTIDFKQNIMQFGIGVKF